MLFPQISRKPWFLHVFTTRYGCFRQIFQFWNSTKRTFASPWQVRRSLPQSLSATLTSQALVCPIWAATSVGVFGCWMAREKVRLGWEKRKTSWTSASFWQLWKTRSIYKDVVVKFIRISGEAMLFTSKYLDSCGFHLPVTKISRCPFPKVSSYLRIRAEMERHGSELSFLQFFLQLIADQPNLPNLLETMSTYVN